MHNIAVGDVNNDGYVDIIAARGLEVFGFPTLLPLENQLFINEIYLSETFTNKSLPGTIGWQI